MSDDQWLAERFEQQRPHLRAIAYRMLGSLAEADDAVQDAWLRASRAGADGIDSLAGWLTTIVSRVCLNMLRARATRREETLESHVPDVMVAPLRDGPEDEAVLADAVGAALLIVLDTLTPAERLAFVLHDTFDVSFDEIAPIVDRTPAAARQLASRARRRVQAMVHGTAHGASSDVRTGTARTTTRPRIDLARQRRAVDAFFSAAREGDFDALVSVLDPDAVLRIDGGEAMRAASMLVRGATSVAEQSNRGLKSSIARPHVEVHPAFVGDGVGVVVTFAGRPTTVMAFTFADDAIAQINAIAEPARVAALTAGGWGVG
jgi:RNA polymerase sigma factor, sigma-70 family